ncbi:MAG TPA: TonB-dependent receptor, partial [Bryobacteraceae bacterium]|nr:TonB-dependent receptor [Bryobacteraceae bacterium]
MRRAVCTGFLLIAFLANLYSQTSTSSISGTISDSTGAVIPGAKVTITQDQTNVSLNQTTTEAGLYSFPAIPVGSYTVTVETTGFKKAVRTGVTLVVNTPTTLDIGLEIGESAETVTVEASAEQLQTSNATIGNVVTQKAIQDLPLNGRNPLALLTLEPGVVQRSNGAAGTGVHVNGSRDMASNVTIDGIEANESSVSAPTNNVQRLNPDSVQEYKVTTSNATAEEGRNSGASVSIATRSGTNQFHGTLFDYFRNTALNSNEFFANALGNPKPDIKMNQYGIEIGGPIKRNQTFFFFSWQSINLNVAQPIDQVYGGAPISYTALARQGIFRYWRADPNNPAVINGQRIDRNQPGLVDSITGELRPGVRNCGSPNDLNCVESYNFGAADPQRIGPDRVVGNLLSQIPLPNSFVGGDGLNTASYFWNPRYRVRGPNFMGRIDHKINDKHSIFGRWLQGENNTLDGDPNNSRPQVYPNFPPLGEVYRTNKNLAIGLRSTLSPRIVNELTFGVSRFVFLFTQGEANPDFLNLPAYARGAGTAFNNIDPGILNTPRTFRAVTTPQILDNITIVQGSHQLKAGFNFRFYRHNDQRGQPGGINVTPLLSFSSTVRPPQGFNTPAIASTTVAGINAVDSTRLLNTINDVMGIPARLSQTFLGDLNSDAFLPYRTDAGVTLWNLGHRLKQYNFYFQDEWKVARNFTVNAGIRWEINPPASEAHGRVYVPDRSIDGSEGLVTFKQADRWSKNFNWGAIGPRLGLTYSPWKGTVVRAGYGIAYDTVSSFQVTAVSGKVPGLTTSCAATVGGTASPGCTGVPDVRLAQGFPQELPPPTIKPSQFLTPAVQLSTTAPSTSVFDQNLGIPTVHQWNLNIQHELPGNFVFETGYVARRGTKLFRGYDLNQISADPILSDFALMQRNVSGGCNPDGTGCPAGVTGATPAMVTNRVIGNNEATTRTFLNSTQSRTDLRQNAAGNMAGRLEQSTLALRLRPNQQFNQILYIDTGGDSYYHSWQTRLKKRFGDGLLVGVAYTFAKSIDNQSVDPVASSSGGGLSTTNTRTPSDIRNWRNERARSDFDRTHVLTSNFIYELPFGKGKPLGGDLPGFVQQFVGDWTVNGVFTAMSGEPFSVRSGVRTSNFSHESRAAIVGDKPEVGLYNVAGVVGPVLFQDSQGFAIPAAGSNGAGRNIFVGPGYWNLDFSLAKRFDITEQVRMQFRAEFFNALNHANFDNASSASVGNA